MNEYYVVSSEILPEVLEKVLQARKLLDTGQVRRISEAVKEVGISRGTYYKYKDAVFQFTQEENSRKAIISLVLRNEPGALAKVVGRLAQFHANILSLNQTIPINGVAGLTLTIDAGSMQVTIDELVDYLQSLDPVSRVELVAVE